MSWRVARSLETLLAQVDAAFPGRSTASDGDIGDQAHQTRTSDHNPNAAGVVTAIDITNDLAHGVDARKLGEALIASKDPRIKYVISNAQIASSDAYERERPGPDQPWVWRPYTGENAHRQHVHISVMGNYDDTTPWAIAGVNPTAALMRRLRMAQAIINFEARRDAQGRIQVYAPPSNDGGGAYEVAGINVRYHPEKAAQLRALIQEGRYQEAEIAARDYALAYTNPVAAWHDDAGVEFYLRDCCWNRGPTGSARILQRAVHVQDDGIVGPITRAAVARLTAPQLLTALRAGREDYERNVVGYRANLWNGLVDRWNKALTVAQQFSQEMPPVTEPTPDPNNPMTPQIPGGIDLGRLRDLIALLQQLGPLLSLLSQLLTGKPMAMPGQMMLPPPAPASPVMKNVAGAGLGVIGSLIASLFGVMGAPIGEGATTVGSLLPLLSIGAGFAGIPAPLIDLGGRALTFLFSRLPRPKT